MLNDRSRGYLQNCCYAKQFSMALLHVSHPPAQTCGGEDILYVYISLIFPGHPEFWDPITNSHLPTPHFASPCYITIFYETVFMYLGTPAEQCVEQGRGSCVLYQSNSYILSHDL